MYLELVLFISTSLLATIHTLALPTLANVTSPASSLATNLPTSLLVAPLHPPNTNSNPSNFLGVECYHLVPATVDLIACQPLFAMLLRSGNIYGEKKWWNRTLLRAGQNPCCIMVSSPSRDDWRVTMCLADIVLYATEVMQTCQETSTGGAYTFQGSWQVIVTRNPGEVLPRTVVWVKSKLFWGFAYQFLNLDICRLWDSQRIEPRVWSFCSSDSSLISNYSHEEITNESS